MSRPYERSDYGVEPPVFSDPQQAQQAAQTVRDPIATIGPNGSVLFLPVEDPGDAALMQRDAVVIQELERHSATFRDVLRQGTNGGQTPYAVRYGRPDLGGDAVWDIERRQVIIDPSHPAVTSTANRQASIVFETINASRSQQFRTVRERAMRGGYASAAPHTRDQRGQPVSPAEMYAFDIERVEWETSQTHHRVMTEARRNGMEIPPDLDTYANCFPSNRLWDRLEHDRISFGRILRA